ncbi:MAG: hypothetical protein LBB76_01675, partial [Azoarcus sp.]|nr:hypothetical protein [Azoarcus sp.]
MKKIIQTWIFPVTSAVVAALLPSPAAALSCDSTTDLVAQANSNEPPAVRDCTLASEKAIHLSATLHSENLVGARGTIVVRFFNQQGIQINQQGERIGRSEEAEDKIYGGPWFGGITGLAFDQTVVVPPNATKVHIWARAASFQDNAMGEWRVADLTVSPGVALVEAADPSLPAEGLPLFVRTTGRPQWRFFSVPGTAVGKFRMELLDMDGRLYAQEVASQSAVTFDFVNLPVGHYQARVRFIPGQGFAEGDAWKSTVAILPDGEPPKEPHFGIDAELSWYGGMPYMVERSAGLIRQAGIGTVRDRMSWNGVQPECTDVNWRGEWGNTNAYENITIDVGRTGAQSSPRYYDHTAQVVKDAGMDSVQVFHDSPACAHGGTTPLIGWPHAAEALSKAPIGRAGNDAAYKFGQEYAQRLGQTVRSIEFWNEQSTTSFYEGYPFQYASALKAFSDGIKSVDPGIRVLIGSSAREPGVFFDETYYNGTADF